MQIKPAVRFFTACLCLWFITESSAKNILVVDSYHADFPWTEKCRKGFEEHIDPEHQFTYVEMDTKRIDKTVFTPRANEIWADIQEMKPDLVVTMDDNALKYLGQRVADAGFPLVFMGVNHNPRSYFRNGQLPKQVTGILERPLLKKNFSLLSKLLPLTNRRILLMMDHGATSTIIAEDIFGDSQSVVIDDIRLDLFMADSYSVWQAKVNSLASHEYDAFIIGSYANLRYNDGQSVSELITAKWTSLISTIPMFTFWSHLVGKGSAVGGVVISGYSQGSSAAAAANTILATGEIPYFERPKQGKVLFSASELARWRLELPEYIRMRSVVIE